MTPFPTRPQPLDRDAMVGPRSNGFSFAKVLRCHCLEYFPRRVWDLCKGRKGSSSKLNNEGEINDETNTSSIEIGAAQRSHGAALHGSGANRTARKTTGESKQKAGGESLRNGDEDGNC